MYNVTKYNINQLIKDNNEMIKKHSNNASIKYYLNRKQSLLAIKTLFEQD